MAAECESCNKVGWFDFNCSDCQKKWLQKNSGLKFKKIAAGFISSGRLGIWPDTTISWAKNYLKYLS